MNASEKIVSDRLEAEGYMVIKNGGPDFTAVKDYGVYLELIFVEVKTNRQPLRRDQKRAMAILRKLEGKSVKVTVKVSRILTKDLHTNPIQPNLVQTMPNPSIPDKISPIHASLPHNKPYQAISNQAKPTQTILTHYEEQDRPFTLDFLRWAAINAETLDEFIVALRNYKKIKPLTHYNSIPIQTTTKGGELYEM